MNKYLVTLFTVFFLTQVKAQNSFDIFSYEAPAGFTLKANKEYLFYSKTEGKNYCQLFLYPAVEGKAAVEKDFETNWNFFACNPDQKVDSAETKDLDSLNGWQMIMGAARGSLNKQMFAVTVSTFTKENISYYVASVFTDKKFIPIAQEFIASVVPDENKFVSSHSNNSEQLTDINTPKNIDIAASAVITKSTTNFDDGWQATMLPDYVRLNKAGTEMRLHYIDKTLDDARPNTVDAPEYYWGKYVEPYFTVSDPQKWSGVQYPVIYHLQGNAVERATGKPCYVAIKIVYGGGARPIVVIAPNHSSYQQQFPHPNDIDPFLNANRFAVSASDIIGTWKGGGGGGVEYYNAYSGTYTGMSAVSSTDEFTFNSDGTYSSMYRTASMNNGGSQFGGQDFKGNATVADWSITATNRFGGKTTTYNAYFIAVKNGYLLYMADAENSSMSYTLYKSK
ncbi:hypothetical protein [Ferruginibacter sp.]